MPTSILQPGMDPQIQEALQRGRDDIVFFAWYFLGITLHPGQIRFLRESDAMVNVLVPGNRFGKTIIIVVRHIWYNFYKKGIPPSSGASWNRVNYRTACIAPFGKILGLDYRLMVEVLESRFKISPEGEPVVTNKCRIGWYLVNKIRTPQHRLIFRDNSSVEFYSTSDDKGSSLQGDYYGYASYDEGGRSFYLETELKQNIGQRLSQMGAPLDLVSTPYADSPSLLYHYEIFQKGLIGEGGFKSFEGSAYENIYLPKWYFEREETRLKGDPLLDQVLYGKFVFAGDTLYKGVDIDACTTDELNGGERFKLGHRYVISTDTAVGSDEQVDTVLEVPTFFDISDPDSEPLRVSRQVGFKGSSKSPQLAMQEHLDLWESYDKQVTLKGILETFNEGSMRWYYDLPEGVRRRTRPYGSALQPKHPIGGKKVTTNGGKKADLLIALRKVLAAHAILLPSDNKELIQQLKMYREDDKNLKTDRVISLALACWLVLEGQAVNPVARPVAINW